MPDTFKVGGTQIKKQTAYIAGAGLALVFGIAWYRSKQQAQQNTSAANAGANTGIDPATGYPYGSAEDAAALANQGQYVNPQDYYASQGGIAPYPGSGTGTTGLQGPGSFTNNAQWAQYVENYLESNEGADPITVGNAIGKYISGQPLTPDMISVVQNAIAIGGSPPVAGLNGNPPSYITSNTTPPPPTISKVKVPYVIGLDLAHAAVDISQAGLHPHGPPITNIRGQYQKVITQSPNYGTLVNKGSTVSVTVKIVKIG
jgi:hypothetical protein